VEPRFIHDVVVQAERSGAVLANNGLRAAVKGMLEPPARGLLKLGVSPDVVTIVGTVGIVFLSVVFIAHGEFLWALLVAVIFAPSDALDGTMARLSGRSGSWGAFLDSTLDRIADGAVFGALVYWYASQSDYATMVAVLLALIGGFTVSYARARAEGLGFTCDVGFAERTERMLFVALGFLLTGMGVSRALPILMWILVVAVWVTVVQRILHVRNQAKQVTT
jgi:CDP-diacylglycerol--glycerol-3-phosphate 3-phosphatidyltransferase